MSGRSLFAAVAAIALSLTACTTQQQPNAAASSAHPTTSSPPPGATAAPLPAPASAPAIPDDPFADLHDVDLCAILDAHILGSFGTLTGILNEPLPSCAVALTSADLVRPTQIDVTLINYRDGDLNGLPTVSLGSGRTASYTTACDNATVTSLEYTVPVSASEAVRITYRMYIGSDTLLDPSQSQQYCAATLAITKALAPRLRDIPRFPAGVVPDVDPCQPLSTVAASLGFGPDPQRGSYDSIQRDPKLMCYARSDQGDTDVWFQPGHGAPDAQSIDPQSHLSLRTDTVDGQQVTLGSGTGGYCAAQWNPPSNPELLVGADLETSGEDGSAACRQLTSLITATVDALRG